MGVATLHLTLCLTLPSSSRGTAGAGPVPGLPRPIAPLRKGAGKDDVLPALQQLMVKQGKGSQGRGYGRGYDRYPKPPYPLPKPRDHATLPQTVMAVEVDQDDLVGAWSLLSQWRC